MRVRPPASGFEGLALYWDKARIQRMTRDLGFEPPASYLHDSLPDCLAEMDAAGIELGVITGRRAGQRMGRVDNDAIARELWCFPQRTSVPTVAAAKSLAQEIDRRLAAPCS